MLRAAYEKYYNPSEPMAIDEVTVLFKVQVIFKQYIPPSHKKKTVRHQNL
jgi:hypothetical protein